MSLKYAIVSMSCLLLCLGLPAWGQQQEVEGPEQGGFIPVEYSNNLDEQAVAGGGNHNGADPQQVLYTQPPDPVGAPMPGDILDYGLATDVDALANYSDAWFDQVSGANGVGIIADLLISFQGDPGGNAVYFELPGGATGVFWTQNHFNNPNAAGALNDVDGLEVWGPFVAADANMYSEIGDPGGTSIWYFPLPAGPRAVYVTQAQITAAINALGYVGPSPDLDALMVHDATLDGLWNAGDYILFSIRAAGNWDGGEVVRLQNAGGVAAFLNHGGVIWNTAHNIQARFGVNTEEVDGLEASLNKVPPGPPVPTVSEWGLIIMTLLLLTAGTLLVARRKAIATAGSAEFSVTTGSPLVAPALLVKSLCVVLGVVAIGLAFALRRDGELAARDIVGSVLSGVLFAYLIHLWIRLARSDEQSS